MDVSQREIPDAEFVRYIDESLAKSDPNRSIPWAANSPPAWAVEFRPRVIFDFGCGLGAFTEAILLRLRDWGCLDRLEQLVLVEGDVALHPKGRDYLRKELAQRMSTVLSCGGSTNVSIEVIVEKVSNAKNMSEVLSISSLEQLSSRKADLIISSHFTYYFGDGSGLEIIQKMQAYHLQTGGKLWCVIRNLNCPIYHKRQEILKNLGVLDPKPYDYAEYFQDKVLPKLYGFELQAVKEHGYNIKGTECKRISHAFMWREMAGIKETAYARAVQDVCVEDDPLFSETHFILESTSYKLENV